ncbi:MAG TPA: T9SS type A sorting domain-containing protein, partial [Saprospiraceae bacterium]|nr:T9SS type A sorting domain-containing protein [Saprospiraceae bacterium]
QATMTVYDMTGKKLKTITGQYAKGKNEILLSASDFNAQGVMFYELESNGQKSTKKMIYLSK